MAEWRLTFELTCYVEGKHLEFLRQVVPRLAKLDPPPMSVVKNGGYKVVFVVAAEGQFEAVRRQHEIAEQLRTALEDLGTGIDLLNPAPAQE